MVYFEKSKSEPASLAIEKDKPNGTYRCEDVLNAIKEDFYNKCYICEWKKPTSINVEHFVPHKGNKDLKFDWKNLFWSCYHCNNTKLAAFNNILNCTIEGELVDKKIKYNIDVFPLGDVEIKHLEDSPKVIETANLLRAVYNGTTSLKKIESENLRDAIRMEVDSFRSALVNFYKSNIPEIKEIYEREIREHLHKSSNFTAFKRWIIFDRPQLNKDFGKYCV